MDFTKFFVDALGSALRLGLASPEDVLRHATPDLLSKHLPRPLWSKLIQACLVAPCTDAKLVVETLGLPAICLHIPAPIVWTCLAEIGARALGRSVSAAPAKAADVVRTPAPGAASSGPAANGGGSSGPAAIGGAQSMPVVIAGAAPTTTGAVSSVPATIGAQPSAPAVLPSAGASVSARAATDAPAPLGAPPIVQRMPTGRVETVGSIPLVKSGPTPPAPASNGARAVTAGASTRRAQSASMSPNGSSPTPAPTKDSRPGTESVEVDVEEEQLIDWAQAEESSSNRSEPDRKR